MPCKIPVPISFRYYILVVVDYAISFICIKKSFLIGSLPTVVLCTSVESREVSIVMRRTFELSPLAILEIMSTFRASYSL